MKHALDSEPLTETPTRQTILLATDNRNESVDIADSLQTMGFDVVTSEYDGERLRATPKNAPDAILFVFTDYIESTPAIIRALRNHFNPKVPKIIGALTRAGNIDTSLFDSIIFPPAHISQIANRVSSMIRLGEMEREVHRRIETVRKDFGQKYDLSENSLNKPFRILFVGKATPQFLVVINALQEKNVEVVAAFTSFSAFDFLHERTFDAVVMNALESSEPALTISDTMRRNSRLFHVPTLLLVNPVKFTDHDLAYKKGARDIISGESEADVISGRILELANYHRIHEQLKAEFSSIGGEKCLDPTTGVFNEEFFASHLRRVCADLNRTNESVSLLAIRPVPNSAFAISRPRVDAAIEQVGVMLRNLVRMQDIVARLEDDIFVIAFPGKNAAALQTVLNRISGIVDCAAFESGDAQNGPFTVLLETAIVEYMNKESSDMLIGHAVAELTGEPIRIANTAAI